MSNMVTDFDNTTSIFDITYQCCVYQLETMFFAMGPEELEAALGEGLDLTADEDREAETGFEPEHL